MQVSEIEPDSPLLDSVYDELLVPAFPAHELVTAAELRQILAAGLGWVSAVVRDGRPDGAAVAEWSPDSGVLLLSYLAVRQNVRSAGIGGALMAEIRTGWQDRVHPLLTLAELEHPAAHTPDPARGDPSARLRFYARHGVRALAVPYFQPSLRPGAPRVPGMLLAQLTPTPDPVPAAPVRAFMTEYFEQCEGGVPTDPATTALFAALSSEGIPLLPLTDPAALPCTSDVAA